MRRGRRQPYDFGLRQSDRQLANAQADIAWQAMIGVRAFVVAALPPACEVCPAPAAPPGPCRWRASGWLCAVKACTMPYGLEWSTKFAMQKMERTTMLQRQLGQLMINRIVESERADFDPLAFFPETTPEDWTPHKAWLQPRAMEPASGNLIFPM